MSIIELSSISLTRGLITLLEKFLTLKRKLNYYLKKIKKKIPESWKATSSSLNWVKGDTSKLERNVLVCVAEENNPRKWPSPKRWICRRIIFERIFKT